MLKGSMKLQQCSTLALRTCGTCSRQARCTKGNRRKSQLLRHVPVKKPWRNGSRNRHSQASRRRAARLPTNPHILVWPVIDGDVRARKASHRVRKGHWLFSGSSGNPPNVEIVQAGGYLQKLTNKVG